MQKNVASWKYKQKLPGFPEDKNSNRKKVFIHYISRSLIRTVIENEEGSVSMFLKSIEAATRDVS